MQRDFEIKTIYRTIDKSTRTIGKIQNSVIKFTSKAAMGMRKLDRANSKVRKTVTSGLKIGFAGLATAVTAVGGAAGILLSQFSKIEDAAAAFEPLMGGAKRARELVSALNETAATTPFQFENLSEVAKLFLPSMNGDIEETIRYTRMLGDATGGNTVKFKSASVAMAKLMMTGKATQEHLGSFVIAGIPIYKELGDMLGVSAEQVTKLTRKGKISSDTMTKVFEKMTSKGGIFYKGMEIASATLTGRISTLKDNLSLVGAELGDAIAPVAKDVVDILMQLVGTVKIWVAENKELIRGTVRKALEWIRDNFEKIQYWASKIGKAIVAFYGLSGAISGASKAMQVLSTVSKMNKFVLLGIAIAAVVAAIWIFKDEIIELGRRLVGWFEYIKGKIIDVANHPKEYMIAAWQETKEAVLSIVSSLWSGIVTVATTWLNTLISLVKFQFSNFADIFSAVGSLLVGNWDAAAAKIFGILERIKSAAKVILDPIMSVMRSVGDYLGFYNPEKEMGYVQNQQKNIDRYSVGGPGVSDEWSMSSGGTQVSLPSVSRSYQREDVNVRITDETRGGRARMEGKSNRVQLAHTGGMP
jgi:tape measure domain-containing protein